MLLCVCSAASAAHKTHFRSAYPVCNRFQNVQRTDVTGRGVSNFAKLLNCLRDEGAKKDSRNEREAEVACEADSAIH